MTYTLTLQQIEPVTHDTYHLTFNRPEGFDFNAGQATHMALDKEGWRDEDRAFTMTSLPVQGDRLEFVIKSYPSHDGVTEKVPHLTTGDQWIAEEPAGAITDHGPGTFIAGGAGITPFIPILKSQVQKGETGSHLIFANETDRDIILKETWDAMEGLKTSYLVSDEVTAHIQGRPDKEMLEKLIPSTDGPFYVCGPGGMVDAVRDSLKEMGVAEDRIITEDGW